MVLEIILWFSIFCLLYAYIGYGGVLILIRSYRGITRVRNTENSEEYIPNISIIVAAFNEERVIERRLKNLFELDYPKDKLEVIIASDGSTDNTVAIAKSCESDRLRILEFPEQRGRVGVHNDAAALAKGEFLIFTDAETVFAGNFLQCILPYIRSEEYGCGSGDLSFKPMGAMGEAESIYWRMEKKLRRLEHELGILPFASGACFIVKKELYEEVPAGTDIDCYLPVQIVRRGYKVFYAVEAKAYDFSVSDSRAYYRKHVRSAAHTMYGIVGSLYGLLKERYYPFLWVIASHRLFRWLGPYLMVCILMANVYLVGKSVIYQFLLGGQVLFYGFAVLAFLEERGLGVKIPNFKWHRLPLSFVLANLAFSAAMMKVIKGVRIAQYEPVSHR